MVQEQIILGPLIANLNRHYALKVQGVINRGQVTVQTAVPVRLLTQQDAVLLAVVSASDFPSSNSKQGSVLLVKPQVSATLDIPST